MASLDEYFKKRIDGAGASFQTQSPTETQTTVDPAKSYIDRVSQTLSGKDPVVQNARQEASTKNAVGDYLANRQAKQESVNAGYTPGTIQSQRTADRYQAVSNEAALGRDAGVNELARTQTNAAMSQANQLRQEGRQDIETLIESVQDPVTKAYLRRIQAAGGDVKSALAGNIGGSAPTTPTTGTESTPPVTQPTTGPVDPNTGLPISKSPAELALENATNEVRTFYPDLDPNSDEFKALVRARTSGASEAELAGIQKANKDRKIAEASTKALSNMASLSEEEAKILSDSLPDTNPLEIPTDKGAFAAFADTNDLVKINGQLYRPLRTMEWRQGQNRDFSVFEGPGGVLLYVDRSGKTTTQPAPEGANATAQARTAWLNSFSSTPQTVTRAPTYTPSWGR